MRAIATLSLVAAVFAVQPGCGDDVTPAAATDLSTAPDLSVNADLATAPADLATPDLTPAPDLALPRDLAYAGPCIQAEPKFPVAGVPAQGWSYAKLAAAFDYSQAPTTNVVANVPSSLATNLDGAILLSNGDYALLPNDSTGHVVRLSPTCSLVISSGDVFDGSLITLAEAANGTVLGIGNSDGQIYALDGAGNSTLFYSLPASARASAVAQLPSGDFAVLGDDGNVYAVSATTGAGAGTLATGAPTNTITLAYGPDNALYTTEFSGGAVWRAPSGGSFTRVAAAANNDSTEGMTVLPNGDLLVADLQTATVVRVSSTTGQVLGTVASGVTGGSRSLQLAPNGRVYLAGDSVLYAIEFPAK